MSLVVLLRALVISALLAGCGRETPRSQGSRPSALPSAAPVIATARRSDAAAISAAGQASDAVVLVTDPATVVELELRGAAFGVNAFGVGGETTRALSRDPVYRSLAAELRKDLDAERTADRQSGVGMNHSHRLFDARWLDSAETRFELVAVVNRLDRRPFQPSDCGELRLVYRLAYRTYRDGRPLLSRLPMTVNVVYWQRPDEKGSCRAAAERWRRRGLEPGPALASALLGADGPLHASRLGSPHRKSIEVNLQTVRWPSTVRPDMAGHSEYLLRVFQLAPSGKRLLAAPLENSPDVERLRRDEGQRAALLAWLKRPETLRAIDAGTAVMPQEWAATKAVSVSPRGLARRANRPFSRLLSAAELADLDFSGLRQVRSPASLFRRLDQLSCAGCHQTRSMAGFHLLGEDRDPARDVDVLLVPISPHLDGDIERRQAYVDAVIAERTPDDSRPFSDRTRRPGSYGAHCGLGDAAFADWTCQAGLTCVSEGDDQVGACLPPVPADGGDPCELGQVQADDDGRRDRVAPSANAGCPHGGACFTNYGGFPGGMCALSCASAGPAAECGKIPISGDFSGCLARRHPFDDCVRQNADPAAMRACDADRACRDDYICQKSSGARGVCIPPYFLFQLRVDGHVLSRGG